MTTLTFPPEEWVCTNCGKHDTFLSAPMGRQGTYYQ